MRALLSFAIISIFCAPTLSQGQHAGILVGTAVLGAQRPDAEYYWFLDFNRVLDSVMKAQWKVAESFEEQRLAKVTLKKMQDGLRSDKIKVTCVEKVELFMKKDPSEDGKALVSVDKEFDKFNGTINPAGGNFNLETPRGVSKSFLADKKTGFPSLRAGEEHLEASLMRRPFLKPFELKTEQARPSSHTLLTLQNSMDTTNKKVEAGDTLITGAKRLDYSVIPLSEDTQAFHLTEWVNLSKEDVSLFNSQKRGGNWLDSSPGVSYSRKTDLVCSPEAK